jgi:hypothetical protein
MCTDVHSVDTRFFESSIEIKELFSKAGLAAPLHYSWAR